MLLKELIRKINTSIWIHCMKKKNSLLERKDEVQRPYTHQNPKRLVSCLLWHKTVVIQFFLDGLVLRMLSGVGINFSDLKKSTV